MAADTVSVMVADFPDSVSPTETSVAPLKRPVTLPVLSTVAAAGLDDVHCSLAGDRRTTAPLASFAAKARGREPPAPSVEVEAVSSRWSMVLAIVRLNGVFWADWITSGVAALA